ncbi:MAG: hypothetical protein ACOY4H_02700 [Thermodesulfobacteriota bacterium]
MTRKMSEKKEATIFMKAGSDTPPERSMFPAFPVISTGQARKSNHG